MSKISRDSDNATGARGPKTLVEKRLSDAGVRVERSASVEEESKACYYHDNQRLPTKTSGNYTIHGGDGLVLLDVDDKLEELPEETADLPSTFVVESPHGGYHPYYALKDDTGISNAQTDWGSIRYEGQYVVGPGSTIDHGECGDGKANCPSEGTGEYEIAVNKPITTLSGDYLEHLREVCASSGSDKTLKEDYGGEQITLPDDTPADEGERYICTEFTRHSTRLAGEDLMDLLRGGTGSYELRRDDETGINQSAADYYALELLYGAFFYRGEDEGDARKLALSVFKRYCRENPYDKTGNTRKWLRKGERYLLEQMDAVQEEFDVGKWHRWRRREYENGFNAEEHKPWTDPEKDGKPSITELDIVRAATRLLASPVTPEQVAEQYGLDLSALPPTYCGEINTPSRSWSSGDFVGRPTASDIGELAHQINPKRERSYHEWVLKKWLKTEYKEVAMAFCPLRANGERYVYYPADLPDPENARYVRCGGEERDPELPEETTEQEVMTDGGVSMSKSESHNKLKQIRQARDGDESSTEGPEVYTCPIDGCSRTVVGEPGHLMNHVNQASDDAHRHRTLNEDLEVVVHWGEMNWGPGIPAFDSLPSTDEKVSVCEKDDLWGPGAPS
ncbi:bifunctional DNA primase/polymerase [Halorussus halophilus]|uniref:bifunctional DNA primase/polymerase n=1 Tax=Halorussus halophilus TaxID=2650975 RepID=UPI001300E744|nr:bifunctional DNA primase/polymerase [Halorussus halophilus]